VSGEGVRIEGLDRLVRTLNRAAVDISDLKNAHAKAGEIVASEAAATAPRISGRLAGSVRAARQARRARVQAGRASVPYAAPIHWGWPARGIVAQPFISEAARATESRWRGEYERDVKDALAKVKGA
jgi:uncharacterized protein YcsI (UPF0317 family)